MAIGVQLAAGLGAMVVSKWPRAATAIGASGAVVACALVLGPTWRVLLGTIPDSLNIEWDATHGTFRLGIDALSACFLLPLLVLPALAAVYGGSYLFVYRQQKSLGPPWFFFNLFVAAMELVVIARSAMLFLMTWEVMSLAAYGLVTFEHEKTAVRRAGWIYLVATHLGMACLIAMFTLLGSQVGRLDFDLSFGLPSVAPGVAAAVFLLAVVGFGTKAGFVPFHVWLPEAHPAAPSHVSALMSGVMIKLGIYGLLRIVILLGEPAAWWGAALGAVGLVTAATGVSLAVQQRNLKRALAYSSIENIGLIALSLGVGLWGMANRLPAAATLGMAAALLHVWNHALMKGLMFLAAGSVLHGSGSGDIEHLGGLMKRMPWTGRAMLLGAVGMAGLPPLNGFISEYLMCIGLAETAIGTADSPSLAALLALGALAWIGTLAALVFVRLTGIALLGSPRSDSANQAHESSAAMTGPMVVVALLCLGVAVWPDRVMSLLSPAIGQLLGNITGEAVFNVEALSPLSSLAAINVLMLATIGVFAAGLMFLCRKSARAKRATWGCGYLRPSARMQYTGSSFAMLAADRLLPRPLQARAKKPELHGLFPEPAEFASQCPDVIQENVYDPLFHRGADAFRRLRFLQQGSVRVYLVYILLAVIAALLWVQLRAGAT